MFFIYNLILILLAILLSPVVGVAFIAVPKLRAGFWEKIGFYKKKGKKSIWVHAVSVGEINATEGLIKRIKKDFPEYNLVVSTVTATGQEIANKKLSDTADVITYFPYDFSFSTGAALKAFDPTLIIIAETEIWPGFVNQAAKKNIPIMLVNGRISPNSHKGYRKFRFFFSRVLAKFSSILMQSESDKQRIIEIGAPPGKVQVMGNLKFDIARTLDDNTIKTLKSSLKLGDSRVIIAGSTHHGEDEMILRVYNRLKAEFDDLKLIIAPRHPERFERVRGLISLSPDKNDIILVDVMGRLSQMYAVSHIAFVGGSFSGTGGHNPLEPAIYNVPVISGPTVFNFKDIYKFMSANGAAKIVNNESEMYNQFRKYLVNSNKYSESCRACAEIFEKNRGALDFAILEIGKHL